MATTEYERFLDVNLRYRVRFEVAERQVTQFAVQLEFFYEGKWQPILRYDTAEGYAHKDMLCPRRRKLPIVASSYNEALTLAIEDIRQRADSYREECETWLRRRER